MLSDGTGWESLAAMKKNCRQAFKKTFLLKVGQGSFNENNTG
jgi:hypothetical protein